jgi:hypothetical protein
LQIVIFFFYLLFTFFIESKAILYFGYSHYIVVHIHLCRLGSGCRGIEAFDDEPSRQDHFIGGDWQGQESRPNGKLKNYAEHY